MTGHVLVTGGPNHEIIHASHGTYNLKTATGSFYDVDGSVGIQPTASQRRTTYTTDKPVPLHRQDPHQDRPRGLRPLLRHRHLLPASQTRLALLRRPHLARRQHSPSPQFRLSPVEFAHFLLPYVTHSDDPNSRQSGFMVPTIGRSSTKGVVLGEQVFMVINRSTDLTVGADYYSSIGWAQNATLRYKGTGYDFLKFHYSGVLDRRKQPGNQGGEEAILAARHDFSTETRAAANIDYLSATSFARPSATPTTRPSPPTSSPPPTSRARSPAWTSPLSPTVTRASRSSAPPPRRSRKSTSSTRPPVAHDHRSRRAGTRNAFSTGLELSVDASGSGLKRTQPNFETGGIIERFDFRPEASYPIAIDDWHIVPSIASQETYYTRSRARGIPGQPPQQNENSILRSDFEFDLAIRAPVVERTFTPTHLQNFSAQNSAIPSSPRSPIASPTASTTSPAFSASTPPTSSPTPTSSSTRVTQRIFRRPKPQAANADGTPKPCATDQLAQSPGFSSDATQRRRRHGRAARSGRASNRTLP